jgi:spore germination cell wall hydrolase CwlJ-like protein
MKKILYFIFICTLLMKPINANAETHIPQEADMTVNNEDLKLMSCIIWHEAEGECEAGKQAVGIVVMNRLADDSEDWGDTIEEILYKPNQFSGVKGERMQTALKMYEKGELPNECINAALYALNGNKVVEYNNKEIDMSDFLYFARHWDGARCRIQDHDFK